MSGFRRDDRGSATLWVAFFFPVLLLVLVLAFDLARMYVARVALKQSAALAVRAAAVEIDPDALTAPEPKIVLKGETVFPILQSVFSENMKHYGGLFVDYTVEQYVVVNSDPEEARKRGTYAVPQTMMAGNGKEVTLEQTGVMADFYAVVELSPLARLANLGRDWEIHVLSAAAPELRP